VNAEKIIRLDEVRTEDAEIVVLAYGCSARTAREAAQLAREKGFRVGFIQLLTIWPFPEKRVRELALGGVKGFVVPEINYGQIAREVERCALGREVSMVGLMGGKIHTPEMVLEAIAELAGGH
jgi:2-oxoglutarate ferredoxin oxidoreductase subunit alpha